MSKKNRHGTDQQGKSTSAGGQGHFQQRPTTTTTTEQQSGKQSSNPHQTWKTTHGKEGTNTSSNPNSPNSTGQRK